MRMTKAEVRIYEQHFDAEMAAMSVSECRRWNPHLSVKDAEQMIANAKAATAKRIAPPSPQAALF